MSVSDVQPEIFYIQWSIIDDRPTWMSSGPDVDLPDPWKR